MIQNEDFQDEMGNNHIATSAQTPMRDDAFAISDDEKIEKYQKLSSIQLFNKYNESLKRDLEFNIETFNVLKYDLNFFSSHRKVYRIDNTDWLIIINPKS